jgi:biotin carboxyl carrier protein
MNIFISHSRKDAYFANKLKSFIENYYNDSRFSIFIDERDLLFGDEIKKKIKSAIYNSDIVLLILSPNSINSKWIEFEINTTLKYEKILKRTVLLPLLITQMELPNKLKHKLFIDCTTAKVQDFNLNKLMRDLAKFGTSQPFQTDENYKYNKYFDGGNGNIFSSNQYISIKSPMIGTFYRSPSPEKPNFVEIGSEVTPGTTLCIIEAMKLYNEIESDVKGKIVEILINNYEPIEYDQPMFLIEPF